MKNQLKFLFIFILFISFGKSSLAQDCSLPQTIKTLQGNNISADILIDGSLFWNRLDAGLSQNNQQYPFPSTIFNAGLWLGGYDSNGDLRIAAASYPTSTRNDYAAGPIIDDNGQMTFDCDNYDQLWEVYGFEIEQHISDFEDNGVIDNPIQNIYSYPALLNPFFESIHGFSLNNTIHGLAPFFDNNNDNVYNPDDGDYPLPESVHNNTIPSHLIWGIYNDAGAQHLHSYGMPLNIEIHQTVWSFNCNNDENLNNSIFTSHKIINKDSSPLDSLYVGFWTDMDVGCYTDDMFGCIPDLNTYYFYNEDPVDGFNGSDCYNDIPTFGDNPPVQAVTILNHEMDNFIYYANYALGIGVINPPYTPTEFYSYLSGWFPNMGGVPLTYGGDGYGGSQATKFAFPSHPNDPQGWSMASTNLPYSDRRSLANVYLNALQPNESKTLDMVYTLYQDENLDHFETVDLVYDNTPLIQQMYDEQFENSCNNTFTCDNDCVWTGDANQDSVVNICDILQIGVGFNTQGLERIRPLTWFPYDGQNWNNTIQGIDLKHTDCNGNATIDALDFELVDYYFGNSYKTDSLVDVYSYGSEITIDPSVNLDTLSPGDPGLIKIKLNQEEDLFGIAFTVEYNPELLAIENNTASLLWLNTAMEDTYLFQKSQPQEGEYHYAIVKTDGENSTTDNGTFLNLGVEVLDSDYELIQTVIRIKNIKAILNDGTTLDYGANEYLISIVNPDGNGVVLENENLENNNIQIFPNPTSDILNIKMENPALANFSIFDIYGKKVFEKNGVNQSEIQLSTSNFSQGVYFLKIEMEGKEFVKKFIKR